MREGQQERRQKYATCLGVASRTETHVRCRTFLLFLLKLEWAHFSQNQPPLNESRRRVHDLNPACCVGCVLISSHPAFFRAFNSSHCFSYIYHVVNKRR